MPGYFTEQRRRRLAPILLIAGLAIVWTVASGDAPRDQEVRVELAPGQRDARSVRLAYRMQGEDITGLFVRYPEGAPALLSHTPSLAPGVYDLSIELGYRDGHVEHLAKTLTVPSDDAIHIRLAP